MSFESILERIVGECGGGTGIALMGSDGIPIVNLPGPEDQANPLADEMAGVELSRVLGEVRKVSDALAGGGVDQMTIQLASFTLTVAEADEDVFLVLAQRPDGNLGKARYLIRRHMLALREEL
jgi:predicted regulator of Ras-like GTPase activity (Roadblock/LC7/MglB family)